MACVTRTYPDNTRTTSQMSGDTLPGQTRTYTFRYVQMSGVRTFGEMENSPRHRQARVDNQRSAFCQIDVTTTARSAARVSPRVFAAARCVRQPKIQTRISDSRRPFGELSALNGNTAEMPSALNRLFQRISEPFGISSHKSPHEMPAGTPLCGASEQVATRARAR